MVPIRIGRGVVIALLSLLGRRSRFVRAACPVLTALREILGPGKRLFPATSVQREAQTMHQKSTLEVNMGMARIAVGLAVAVMAYAEGPTFEVAAIKVNKSESRNSGFRRAGPGQLNATNASLKMLIEYAYDVRDYQLTGGPGWLDTERYDILAKPA